MWYTISSKEEESQMNKTVKMNTIKITGKTYFGVDSAEEYMKDMLRYNYFQSDAGRRESGIRSHRSRQSLYARTLAIIRTLSHTSGRNVPSLEYADAINASYSIKGCAKLDKQFRERHSNIITIAVFVILLIGWIA